MEAVILWCWDWRVIYLTTASKSYRQSLPAGMTVSYFHPCCLKLLVKTSLQTSPAVVDFNPTTPSVYVSDCICVFILCFFPLSPFIARLIVSPLSSPSFFFYCISIIFHSNDAQISLSCLRWLIKIHKIKKDKQTKKHGLFFFKLAGLIAPPPGLYSRCWLAYQSNIILWTNLLDLIQSRLNDWL